MLKVTMPATGKRMPVYVLSVLTLLTSYTAQAQTASDSLLTQASLPAVIQYALKHQPAVQQAGIDEKTTELQIKSKLADWYPQLNLNYLYQHNFQVQTSVIGGNPVRLGVNNTSAIQFSATQALFNRDVLLASRTKGDVRMQAKQLTESARINVASSVSKAFYDVLATQQQIRVAEENIVRLERSLKDARAAYDAGVADKTDYKRATIALNNAKATRMANAEGLNAKLIYLKTLMNYPSAAELPIEYDSLALENEVYLDTLAPVDYSRRIEYQTLQTQLRLQKANLQYNKWSFIPTLSANAGYNLNFLNNDFGKLYSQNFPNSFAGLTLSFPIFQGGKRKYNIQQAEWQVRRTELELTKLNNSISAEYSAALASYRASKATYEALRENLLLAKEVYDVINLQYRSGIKTYLEVITAETDLRTAQINYYNALYQVLSSKIDVQVSLGNLTF
ncbi:MAG: TolC family protein [Sphingobacteriales bacterium]|nr:TolC family protein [Sphingobacteriales bacterium]NCT72978.1 TolC family protein [Chitinophagaceae bacterium]OJW30275.1 MAG: transporter [Sphingobacteriales bacterium 46-32]